MLLNMREIEAEAAAAVVAELGAVRAERVDSPGAGDALRDFDVVFADHLEPLEVTTNANESALRSRARLAGNEWIEARVRRHWMVTGEQLTKDSAGLDRPFDVRECIRILRPLVEALDSRGFDRFDSSQLAWPLRPDDLTGFEREGKALFDLGVRSGGSFEPQDPDAPRGISLHIGWGGFYGETTLATVAAAIAARADNVAKLAACREAPRRHLYVALVSVSDDMAWPALDDVLFGGHYGPEAVPCPDLPDEITTAWIGVAGRGIYVTPPEGWEMFGGPEAI